MPEYDAVFVTPEGQVLYSNGLRPPSAAPGRRRPPLLRRAPEAHLQQRVHFRLGGEPVLGLVSRGEAATLGAQVGFFSNQFAAALARNRDARRARGALAYAGARGGACGVAGAGRSVGDGWP